MKENKRTTAAAAYHWVSELYNRAPYSIFEDRIQHDETKNIQHGIFIRKILILILIYLQMRII